MFTTIIERGNDFGSEIVTLNYKSESFSLTFLPNVPRPLPLTDCGEFDGNLAGGTCNFSWNPNTIIFNISCIERDGGGNISITINNSPEIMDSLFKAIEIWNTSPFEKALLCDIRPTF